VVTIFYILRRLLSFVFLTGAGRHRVPGLRDPDPTLGKVYLPIKNKWLFPKILVDNPCFHYYHYRAID
jgi:hypothetical protein